MADERDFELLDDYLTNRLSEQDRSAFEARLKADPDLQQELVLQKRLVQGIKNIRIAELKSMFNNVPVSALGPENTMVSKMAIAAAFSILIAVGAYWYFNQNDTPVVKQTPPVTQPLIKEDTEKKQPATAEEKDQNTQENNAVQADKNQTSAGTEDSKPSLERKPAPLSAPEETTDKNDETKKEPVLDVYVPADEDTGVDNAVNKENHQVYSSKNSSLIVETDTENRRYSFHYQFKDGKLFLYGPLEKNLYEILEFFSDEKRTVFLYYKDNYYLLEEKDFKIRPLTAISDPSLLKKLKESRSTH